MTARAITTNVQITKIVLILVHNKRTKKIAN